MLRDQRIYVCFFPLLCLLSQTPIILLFKTFFKDVNLNMYKYINIYACVFVCGYVYIFPPQPTATTAISLLEKIIPIKHFLNNCGKKDWSMLPFLSSGTRFHTPLQLPLENVFGGFGRIPGRCLCIPQCHHIELPMHGVTAGQEGDLPRGSVSHPPCPCLWIAPLQENVALVPLPPIDCNRMGLFCKKSSLAPSEPVSKLIPKGGWI